MKLLPVILLFFSAFCQSATAAVAANNGHANSSQTTFRQSSAAASDRKEQVSPEDSLGQMLYANHCTNCHESAVHMRAHRKAKNLQDLVYWVNQRADWLQLGWTVAEKRAVMDYVNQRYYHYPVDD